jgi:hypothetical protein
MELGRPTSPKAAIARRAYCKADEENAKNDSKYKVRIQNHITYNTPLRYSHLGHVELKK